MPEAEAASRAIQIFVGCQLQALDFTRFHRLISTSSYQTSTTVRYWPEAAVALRRDYETTEHCLADGRSTSIRCQQVLNFRRRPLQAAS